MVEFAGWEMPLQYPTGMVKEHLATRGGAGLFDISHMGRFVIRGADAGGFLQHVLTNNTDALDVGKAQYTMVPNEAGGAIDDAYLYRFTEDEFLLVVNAGNIARDWEHLQSHLNKFGYVELADRTEDMAMLSLQGPASRDLLGDVIESGQCPEPMRNALSIVTIGGAEVKVGRTGYAGEPLGFEFFVEATEAPGLWDILVERGATPIGLGARDTLRLEASLPLYGHELGMDAGGHAIPIFSCPLAQHAVSFSQHKGDFIGRARLQEQFEALKMIRCRNYSRIAALPRMVRSIALVGPGVARAGARVFRKGRDVGYVTSGNRVPYWLTEGLGLSEERTGQHALRSICLGYVDSDIMLDEPVTIEVRGKPIEAVVVPWHLRGDAPPFARPIIAKTQPSREARPGDGPAAARQLLAKTLENTLWRQRECINLIPSQMTASPMVRMLSVMDPAFRYAEHRKLHAFYDTDVFYYQGTDFIDEVERLLEGEMCRFIGCREVETRLISGQMANAVVFSAMVDYLNRNDRKSQPRRIRCVMNHHIGKGGHLSAQAMGALKDYVAHDPRTERASVVNFPVLADNPYRVDLAAAEKLIEQTQPELIIVGKSVILHPEPVAEIRKFLDAQGIGAVLMYDMAHVLGLIGPHFQQPFADGADLVTASTHKTFFGTQRGIVAGDYSRDQERYALWEALERRTFPGSVSNQHLGTLLGLLMAAYEMNHFKDEYQRRVLSNAKAFAVAMHEAGLDVAGDPAVSFTETHQVVVNVGYGRGPELARRLEENNIICNYQAAPDEEGFTASGALRLGVAEMTRWGMKEDDFRKVASLIHDVVTRRANVVDAVRALRAPFSELMFCFRGNEYDDILQKLHNML